MISTHTALHNEQNFNPEINNGWGYVCALFHIFEK